jgi:hypothetical protein
MDAGALANLKPDVEHGYATDRNHALRHVVSEWT